MAVRGTGLPANRDDQRSGPLPPDSDGTVLLSRPLGWRSAPISPRGARLASDTPDPPRMSASETGWRLRRFQGFNTATTTSPHCMRDGGMTPMSAAGGSWNGPLKG